MRQNCPCLPLANVQVAGRPACTAPASPIWSQRPAILALPSSAHLLVATLLVGLTCNRSLPGGVLSALALPVTVLCPSYSQQVTTSFMLILWAPKLPGYLRVGYACSPAFLLCPPNSLPAPLALRDSHEASHPSATSLCLSFHMLRWGQLYWDLTGQW